MSSHFKPNPEHTSCAVKGLAEFNDVLGRLSDVRKHLLLSVLVIMYWGQKNVLHLLLLNGYKKSTTNQQC